MMRTIASVLATILLFLPIAAVAADDAPPAELAAAQKIRLDVRFVDVAIWRANELGVDFATLGSKPAAQEADSDEAPLKHTTPMDRLLLTADTEKVMALLAPLIRENCAKITLAPSLFTTSGRPVSFESEEEIRSSGTATDKTKPTQNKKTGREIHLVPTLDDSHKVHLDVRTSLRSVDAALAGARPPGIRTHAVDANCDVSLGQTLIVGGIIVSRVEASVVRRGFLDDLPFSRPKIRQDLVDIATLILVTPQLTNDVSEPAANTAAAPAENSQR